MTDQENAAQDLQETTEEKQGCIALAVQLPWVGSWISLGFLLVPVIAVALALLPLGWAAEPDTMTRFDWFGLLLMGIASLVWLRFLRARTGVVLSFYFVPCIWLSWALIATSAFFSIVG